MSTLHPKTQTADERVESLLHQLTLREKVALLSGKDSWQTVPIDRLGIPSLVMTDGPHGVRAPASESRRFGPTTAFPTGVSLAATWNPALIEAVGQALADETRAMGCDVLLGPCVNIMRTPLAGRNFEAYAEDPYLAGRIGTAWVKGLQSRGVAASLKHFACNNQETERFRGNSVVDERTLREIYFPAFEAIVKEARPWTVMCAYNRLNGVYASQSAYLLTQVLRDEWGFDGLVVSDWFANHTTLESMAAGLDLEMPGPAKYYGQLLFEAVSFWQIDEESINTATRRVLQLLARCGRLDEPARLPAGAVNTPTHQALAQHVAEEAVVLLKNEGGLLPLDPGRLASIAVIGPNAAEGRLGGGGSAYVTPPYSVSPLEGLRARLGDRVAIRYEQGCDNFVEPPVIPAEWLVHGDADEPGLVGAYFANAQLVGEPEVTRVDTGLNWRWVHAPPAENVPLESFSVRWTGALVAPATGHFGLTLMNTASARLYLDGRLLIDHTSPEQLHLNLPEITVTTEVDLLEGRRYDLRVEFLKPASERYSVVRLCLARAWRPGEDARVARAAEVAAASDAAVVCVGLPERYETEGHDRPDWRLTGPQDELVQAVVQANPRTIVVLNSGAPVAMPWVEAVPALLQAFYPGLEGGHAVASILTGDANPSGKLPVSFPRRFEDNPSFLNYPGGRDVLYGEGIFVGYRYYDKAGVAPLFPFGHGLSYTAFEYSRLNVPDEAALGQPLRVSVVVKNTGQVAGAEVVQLYVGDPVASLPRPPKELKAFQKVALDPGESATVSFELDERALSFYDPAPRRWVAEPGVFEIMVGSSSRDIRATGRVTVA